MTRKWKPGDVAMVGGRVCIRIANDMWEHGQPDLFAYAGDERARPLTVADPLSDEHVYRLGRLLWHMSPGANWGVPGGEPYLKFYEDVAAALREFADPTPPKPEEPTGLGAVVESENGDLWVRHGLDANPPAPWCDDSGVGKPWHKVPAVRVLSHGVTR